MNLKPLCFKPLSLALLSLAIAVFSSEVQAQPESKKAESGWVVFRLNHLAANDALQFVQELTATDGAKLMADPRRNVLIVVGTPDQLKTIKGLLEQLDVPETRKENKEPSSYFKIYPFANQESIESGYNILSGMLANEPVKMDYDRNGLKLFFHGADRHHEVARMILEQIANSNSEAEAEAEAEAENIHISTVLIVDAAEMKEEERQRMRFKELNEQLKSVISKANEKGLLQMSKPVVASRISSLVSSSKLSSVSKESNAGSSHGQFSNQSTGYFSLSNSGELNRMAPGKYSVSSNISIVISGHGSELALRSNVELPMNHPVLLSYSTIQSYDSVVVIQLTAE